MLLKALIATYKNVNSQSVDAVCFIHDDEPARYGDIGRELSDRSEIWQASLQHAVDAPVKITEGSNNSNTRISRLRYFTIFSGKTSCHPVNIEARLLDSR